MNNGTIKGSSTHYNSTVNGAGQNIVGYSKCGKLCQTSENGPQSQSHNMPKAKTVIPWLWDVMGNDGLRINEETALTTEKRTLSRGTVKKQSGVIRNV